MLEFGASVIFAEREVSTEAWDLARAVYQAMASGGYSVLSLRISASLASCAANRTSIQARSSARFSICLTVKAGTKMRAAVCERAFYLPLVRRLKADTQAGRR